MLRVMARTALSIALGVAASVAVAWGLRIWYATRVPAKGTTAQGDRAIVVDRATWLGSRTANLGRASSLWWPAALNAQTSAAVVKAAEEEEFGRTWFHYGQFTLVRPAACEARCIRGMPTACIAASCGTYGWPSPCLRLFAYTGKGWSRLAFAAEVPSWLSGGQYIAIPLLPAGWGLALNTGLYGAVWFAGFSAGQLAIRRLRRHRGECEWCRYDLRGLSRNRCPECGRAVTD